MRPVDMSPEAITQRLLEVSELADLDPAQQLESKLDLTPSGITQRLRRVSDLRRLCLALAKSEPVEG